MYLTQSKISEDAYITARIAQCAAQQGCAQDGIDPDTWAREWRRVWASSPGWDGKWESALARPDNPPGYLPGADEAVITDQDILSQVQAMMPFNHVGNPIPGAPV